jgi:hypothetical protein
MIRKDAQADARGQDQPAEADILRRIASLVGEIDSLKDERHAAPALGARAKLAAAYFRKRRPALANA